MDIEKLIKCLRNAKEPNTGLTDYQSVEQDAIDAIMMLCAELERAHEDNKMLWSAMMSVYRADDIVRNEIVFRVSYEDVLTHDHVQALAQTFVQNILREDALRREQDG